MSQKKFDAFISYSRRNFNEVKAFIDRITDAVPGFRYWFDLDGIESGDEFVDKIVVAIDSSECLLFMVSDDSLKSAYAKDEVMYAHNTGKRVIPVLLDNAKLSGWFLFKFGKVDTIDSNDSRQVNKLIGNIISWRGSGYEPSAQDIDEDVRLYPIAKGWFSVRFGFRDDKAQIVIPCTFENTRGFTEGLAAVEDDGKWGYIDGTGKTVIQFVYEDAGIFSEGLAPVFDGRKWGYIDRRGTVAIPLIFDSARPFSEGRARVGAGGRLGFINRQGEIVIPHRFKFAGNFSSGVAPVAIEDLYGLIDREGREVISPVYKYCEEFSEERAWAIDKSGKIGFIDSCGKIVAPFIYEKADSFSGGLARVMKDGRYGFIDRNGNIVVPCKYAFADSFSEGLAVVEDAGKYGFIDRNGNIALPFDFDEAVAFSGGLALVKKGGRKCFINHSGQTFDY